MVKAVKQSMGSVLSSGLTTVTGFAALILMRFKIGPDMGYVMAKAIVFSLICVLCFLPALAISTYRLIDKTRHRAFWPDFREFAKAVLKVRIGTLVGRGAVISFILVLFVLPALLMIFDRLIEKTTAKTKFYKEEFRHEPK